MDKAVEFKYKSKVTEILPNTERTRKMMVARLEEENKKKRDQEKRKEMDEKEKKFKLQQIMEEEKLKTEKAQQQKEEKRRAQEELQQISTLKGRFGNMILQLNMNKTPLDLTITGLSLLSAQIRILMQAIKNNRSLKTLVMVRKQITDEDAIDIAKCLSENITLEKVEIEGNLLGPEAGKAFGDLIKTNKVLRVIDLENNDLTKKQRDISGIVAICEGIKQNSTLLCLNLSNTQLDMRCSQAIMDALEQNHSIIQLDIDSNRSMDIFHVRAIQDFLTRNYADYKIERYNEFVERKRMKREEDISSILATKEEAILLVREGINQRINMKNMQNDEQWHQLRLEDEVRKQKEITKLERLALFRSKKGKRRRGGMGKMGKAKK